MPAQGRGLLRLHLRAPHSCLESISLRGVSCKTPDSGGPPSCCSPLLGRSLLI